MKRMVYYYLLFKYSSKKGNIMLKIDEFETFMNVVEQAKTVLLKFKKETNGEIVEKEATFSDLPDADKKSNRTNYVKNSLTPLIFKSKADKDSYRSCYFKNIVSYSAI